MLGTIIGAGLGAAASIFGANKNASMQKTFAKKGIQWKVEDAKKAGIHPLYALGANTNSFSNVAGYSDAGAHFANAGQNIDRAIDTTRTRTEKVDDFTRQTQALTLQRMGLENQVLASRLARLNSAGNPPARPGDGQLIPGQGETAGVTDVAQKREGHYPGDPRVEAGAVTDQGHTVSGGDRVAPVMSKDAKDRLEEDMPGIIGWNMRNRLWQNFQMNMRPPFKAPIGTHWIYNPFTQEYMLRKTRTIYDATRDHPARTGKPYR